MIISQVLTGDIGHKFGGTYTVKTCKKTWEVEGSWMHQVILTDKTGDILADINIIKYLPMKRGSEIRVIVGEVQSADVTKDNAKKIYVDQFEITTQIGEPEPFCEDDSTNIVRGKIACLIVASFAVNNDPEAVEAYSGSETLRYTVDNVMRL